MKTIYSSIIILTLVFAAGCNPNHPTPGTPSSYKVKTVTVDSAAPFTLTYDNLGRVTDVGFYSVGYEAGYVYNGSTSSITSHFDSNVLKADLDAQGHVVFMNVYDQSSPDTPYLQFRYTYDSQGFMQTKEKTRVANATSNGFTEMYHFQWVDSCLMSICSDSGSAIETFTYYPVREFRDGGLYNFYDGVWTMYNCDALMVVGNIWGNHSKYVMRTSSLPNGTVQVNYTYQYDQYDRVTTQYSIMNSNTRTIKFTYY